METQEPQVEEQEEPQPEEAKQVDELPVDPFANLEYPVVALIRKYADAIPVEVKDRAHLDRLIQEHGTSLEVQ